MPGPFVNRDTILTVAGYTGLAEVTLSLDTVAYADGDVLADTQEITNFFDVLGGSAKLTSVQVNDEDDQGTALDLIFLRSNVSLGTENAAPSITDANAREIIGRLSIATSDFIDLGGVRVATKSNVGLILSAAAGSNSLWIGAITRGGTPTYTAAGIRVKLGFEHA